LEKLGYRNTKVNTSKYFPDDTRAYCQVYLQLQEALQAYITSGKESYLSEYKKPTGAWEWNPESIKIDEIKSANIYREGIDRRAKSDDFVEHLEDKD
jgi:hypothetical protein